MDKNEIVLIGGGGHCKSCIDVIEQENRYQIVGVVDLPSKIGEKIMGYSIIGCDNDLEQLSKKYKYFLITLGQIKSAKLRNKLFHKLKSLKVELPVIQSPLSYVSTHAQIGEGTIVMHQSVINAEARIGLNCILNTGCLIEHEAVIGDHCHISTHAVINGQVNIGKECFIGSNSVLANNITVSNGTIVAAGANVLKSIHNPGVYLGSLVRKIK